ncbi:glycosyltransferase family 1 protein [Bacillus altitudinis]|uniref:glycosyltransferase family 1 protein n=1 Tax=Bacillus altitudinis TaxID=293387 RepID=UPI0002BD5CC0|nr:glycosyltransferase family 1 protein [Bacillus altitudinis]EMI12878.1 glycosyl transferase group 1 [Bacillus stratosphericus LAMA 585]MCY7532254.1 glycosyltransferase family 1 protein [Bacillus altitudinis]
MSEPKRVLHVVGGMNRGGAETMIMNIYRAIDRNVLQFDFITHREDVCDYDEEIRQLGGRIFYVPSIGASSPWTFVKKLTKTIKQTGPYQAVHAHTDFQTGFSALAAKLAGVKIRICHSHNTAWKQSPSRVDHLMLKGFRQLIFAFSTKLVACGEDAGVFLFGQKRMHDGRVDILPNGIDLDLFFQLEPEAKVKMKKDLHLHERKLIIGHIGRFHEQKNHVFFIELAQTLKKQGVSFQLVLIGDGPLRPVVESYAVKAGLMEDIVFTGVVSEVPKYMKAFDVFVMPSLFEGLPLVLVEAQASGLPCVISDHITKEVDLGCGLVKRKSLQDSAHEWMKAILEAYHADPPLQETIISQLGLRGFDVKQNITRVMNVYGL